MLESKLNPRQAPLSCYSLDQDEHNPECKACPHFDGCREAMGTRAGRIPLNCQVFDLIPAGLAKGPVADFDPEADVNMLYQATYRLVYGSNPNHTVGKYARSVFSLARKAKVTLPNYILINMVGYQLAWPEKQFVPGCLADGRALARVKTYAKACTDKFGSVDMEGLDAITGQDNAQFSLRVRMLDAEVTAGKWIIEWKLDHEGPPYEAMFDELELELDINWLAIEPRFAPRIQRYIQKANATANSHEIADKLKILRRRRHESYANFVYRQMIMPKAVDQVLEEFGYLASDFERVNKPVTDTLQFWHRLALAIQHLECLKWIDSGTGYYAEA